MGIELLGQLKNLALQKSHLEPLMCVRRHCNAVIVFEERGGEARAVLREEVLSGNLRLAGLCPASPQHYQVLIDLRGP